MLKKKLQMMTSGETASDREGELMCSADEQLFVSIYPSFCEGIQTSHLIWCVEASAFDSASSVLSWHHTHLSSSRTCRVTRFMWLPWDHVQISLSNALNTGCWSLWLDEIPLHFQSRKSPLINRFKDMPSDEGLDGLSSHLILMQRC